MASTDLEVGGEDSGHDLVEAPSDVPGQPPFATCSALFHGDFENDSSPVISFSELRPPNWGQIPLVTSFTPDQRPST